MAYPTKPTGNNILPENTIFAINNTSKQVMTTSEILNGYNNDGEAETALTSRPDANRFNMFWYQVHNTVNWLVAYVTELYSDKLSKAGGTMSGNLSMNNRKITNLPTPTQKLDAVNKEYVDNILPLSMWIGEIKSMAYPNIPNLPSGMEVVPCDGRAISRSTYSKLYSLIGTTFGVGNGTTTFNIPDYRGLILRGWDGGSGRDTGRVYGTIQKGNIPNHTHTYSGTTSNQSNNHTHTRGTMNITATGAMWESTDSNPFTGAFYRSAEKGHAGTNGGMDYDNFCMNFDASRSWTGETSGASQNHNHAFSGTTSNVKNSLYTDKNELIMANANCYYLIRIK